MADEARKVIEDFGSLLAQTPDPAQRARLIKKATLLGAKEVPDEVFEPPITPLGVYLDTPIEIPASLVWPTVVVRGEITTTLGRAGKGKTTMNLNRLMRWACGRPLFDSYTSPHKEDEGKVYLSPEEPIKSLVLENEGSAGMFHQKVGIMLYNSGDILTEEDRKMIRENMLIWGDGGYSGLKLDSDKGVDELRRGIEKFEPDIVFVEPFRQLWKGEENSSTDMAVVIDNILAMATDYNAGFIISHHERKGGTDFDDPMSLARGSTVLEGAVQCMENFHPIKNEQYRELAYSKSRYLQPPPPTRLQYDRESGWYMHVPESDLERAILDALEIQDEPINKSGLCEILEEKPYAVGKALDLLVSENRVRRKGSISSSGGSTGHRYEIVHVDEEGAESGLGF